jgi:outer membrane protein TolC
VQGSFGQTNLSNQTYRVDVSQRFANGTGVRAEVGASTAQIPGAPGESDIRFYNADTTLMLTQPLLKGLGTSVVRRALTTAELREADAARQQTITEQQTAIDVARAYYRVVAQEALVAVARKSFESAKQLREASEAKLTAGLVSQLDVLRAQQLVSQAELQLFDAQSAVADARDQLGLVMGRDGEADFDVVVEIPKIVDALSVEDATSLAVTRRLDLQIAVDSAADAVRAVSYARNQLLPQFDVNAALTRRQTSNTFAKSFGLDGFRFATFFNISVPVDRTSQVVDFQNALIDRDQRARDIETIRRRITGDVKREVRERDRAVRNLAAAEALVQIAQKEVEVARFRYERGLSNNLDVVTAETNLLNAESRRITTLADLAVIRLSLRATVGILDPRQDTAAAPPLLTAVGVQ